MWNLCEKQTIEKSKITCKCKTSDETVAIKYGKLPNLPSSTPNENDKSVTENQLSQTTIALINGNSQTTITPEISAENDDFTNSNNSNASSESTDNALESSNGVRNSSKSEDQKNSENNLEQGYDENKPIKLNAVTIIPTGSITTKWTKKPPAVVQKKSTASSIKSVTPASSQKPSHTTAKTTKNTITTTPVLPSVPTTTSMNSNATNVKTADSKILYLFAYVH